MNIRTGWKCVLDDGGRRIFVRSEHAKIFGQLAKHYQRNYMWTQLYRAFVSLKGHASMGQMLDRSGTIRRLSIEAGDIEYYMDNGDILINRLQLGRDSTVLPSGLYEAKYLNYRGEWRTSSIQRNFNLNNTWNGAHYAAIGEDAGDKDKVANYMANQLFMGYSKEIHKKTIESSDPAPSFSLYYLKSGDYKEQVHAEQIAAMIQHAADNSAPVNWLVHGRAAVTFHHALESLKALTSLNSLRKSNIKQEVFVSSPVGVHISAIDKLAQEVGFTRHGEKGYNLNPYYLQSSYISGNAFSEIAMAGRLSKAAGDGKLKQVSKTFAAAISNPVLGVGLAGAGLAAGAAGLIGQTTAKTLGVFFAARTGLNMAKGAQTLVDGFQALAHSNVGTGKYFYYENPSQLMKAVKSSALSKLK